MGRPLKMNTKIAGYVAKQLAKGKKIFPLVTIIEPLEQCNLRCTGCGRIREYSDHLDEKLTPEEVVSAADESGAPVVSISGGEPLIHPQIETIVQRLIEEGYYIMLCTNGLLLEEKLKTLEPDEKLAFAVHLDGTEEVHDDYTNHEGAYERAFNGVKKAIDQGYRVTTNTTIFKESDPDDLHELFRRLTDVGVEGIMLAPGYNYASVDRSAEKHFLERKESIEVFREILDPEKTKDFPFYNTPLYLDFLRGKRDLQCNAWASPTYTVLGWRKPCYILADDHVDSVDEILDEDLWENYGVGKDRRCNSCMIHSGFDTAGTIVSLRSREGMVDLVKSTLPNRLTKILTTEQE
ncbi:MAG: adenosyl-hopene transferase HpnH [Candidatus Bipolaricaulota bacterium]